ncbi:hypothetical protein LXL04_035249 [Taraxacum kok-saghyz]
MSINVVDLGVPEDTHDYYDVTFYQYSILTLVTATPSFVESWISEIEGIHRHRLQSLIVGLNIEWRPRRRKHEFPVATLQLCVGRHCLIFQILHSPSIPWTLRNFLLNTSYTFVGPGIDDYIKRLNDHYNLHVGRTTDLRALALEFGRTDLGNAGLRGLTRIVLGKEYNKKTMVMKSRWDNRSLSPAQVEYACLDAFLSFEIGKFYISAKRTRSRFELAV